MAYQLARQVLPDYASKFSRHDFTLAQLFACLVLRERLKLSYRGVEALLADSPEWRRMIGMTGTPDHNTLWRAFGRILSGSNVGCLLDLIAAHAQAHLAADRVLAVDATLLEGSHVSRHFERRREQSLGEAQRAARRKNRLNTLPRLTPVVGCGTHLVLAAVTGLGTGSDRPAFGPLLAAAKRRCRRARWVLADAGYDAEASHHEATRHKFHAVIPPKVGRRVAEPGTPRRRRMARRWGQVRVLYGQRWQVETVHSMIKRNQGSALRARSVAARATEMMLKVLTHNIAVLHVPNKQGRDRAVPANSKRALRRSHWPGHDLAAFFVCPGRTALAQLAATFAAANLRTCAARRVLPSPGTPGEVQGEGKRTAAQTRPKRRQRPPRLHQVISRR